MFIKGPKGGFQCFNSLMTRYLACVLLSCFPWKALRVAKNSLLAYSNDIFWEFADKVVHSRKSCCFAW